MNMSLFHNKSYLLVPFILLLFYIALPCSYKTCDAFRYAEAIESKKIRSDMIWHPSHILYGPLGYVVYNSIERIGITCSPFKIYSILGIISSALIVIFMGSLMLHFGASSRMVTLILLLWMSTYVAWVCSTSSDYARNTIAAMFILSAFYSIALSTRKKLRGWPYLTGLLLGFAGISHILSIFSAFPLFYFAYRVSKQKLTILLKIAITSFAIISSTYFFVATELQNIKNIRGFLDWFRGPGGSEWIQMNPIRGIVDLLLTSIRAVFGIVTYQPLKTALLSIGSENTKILLLGTLAGSLIAGCCVLIWKSLRKVPQTFTPLGKAMIIWFCSHAIFATFFDSGNIRMLLFLSIPFMLILGDAMKSHKSVYASFALFFLFLFVLTVNTSTSFLKESRSETQRSYQIMNVMDFLSHDSSDLFIVTTCTDAFYARYFGARKTFILDSKSLRGDSLYNIAQNTLSSGHKVFILNELVDVIREHSYASKHPLLDSLVFDSRPLRPPNSIFQEVFFRTNTVSDDRKIQ